MTSTSFPPPLIIEPSTKHGLTVILLHGRGSTGPEFSEEFFNTCSSSEESLTKRFPSVRWVFPSARIRTSTVFREDISEWYDVYSLSNPEERLDLQKPGLVESIQYVTEIVEFERRRVEMEQTEASSRSSIVLGGISMGCAVGIHVLLNQITSAIGNDIRGFFGWCGWFPFSELFREHITSADTTTTRDDSAVAERISRLYSDDLGITQQRALDGRDARQSQGTNVTPRHHLASVPVFLSHSSDDNVVDASLGRQLKDILETIGMQVEWHEYADGEHWIKEPEGMDELANLLEGLISP